MKKKAIEKIPYIGIQRVIRRKDAKYVGATVVNIIGNEEHLITEVYRNKKENLDVPLVRIVLTKKDFGTFFVESGEWSRGLIARRRYHRQYPVWDQAGQKYNTENENVIRSDEDLQRIKSFPGIEVKSWLNQPWYELINDRISTISTSERRARKNRRLERRQQALKERAENTPEIDEKKILDYADRVIFQNTHYLYYKKHGVRARVACSKCGGVTERRWKQGISYESQMEAMIDDPRRGHDGICPLCGEKAKWKTQGEADRSRRFKGHIFVGQKYKQTGMVFRYFEVEKKYLLGQRLNKKGQAVMENACEELSGIEIARVYFEDGKEPQKDYHKSDPYTGRDYWDDCNLSGMSNISIREAPIFSGTYAAMKGTILQYSAMKEYEKAEGRCINPVAYAERYMQIPQIEMLVKLGLIEIVKHLVEGGYSIVADKNAKRVDTFLGIRKEHVLQLIRNQGELEILKVMQTETRMEQHWSDRQIEHLAELGVAEKMERTGVLKYMGIQEMLNLIEKYAGAECHEATTSLMSVAQTYIDYIAMRQKLGYDMSNSVYLAPRNLYEAHQKMVMESNKIQIDKRINEVNIKYPLIKTHYRRLRTKFYYADKDFVIRPARSAGEIVMEGLALHHCVGGDDYLCKHNSDISTILFLRLKKASDVPYITVEIGTQNLKLMQWHGNNNANNDKVIDRWLKCYINRLKCGKRGAPNEAGEAAGQQAPAMPA